MAKYQGQRMVKEDEHTYLQELIESHDDPSADWGSTYTAGPGIEITSENLIRTHVSISGGLNYNNNGDMIVDNSVVAFKNDIVTSYNDLTDKPDLSIYAQSSSLATVATSGSYSDLIGTPTIPDAVSGTNDGTNWTSLTIGQTTYNIPAGGSGGSSLYLHHVKLKGPGATSGTWWLSFDIFTKSSTPITTLTELKTQIMMMQETPGDDTPVGILFGQYWMGSSISSSGKIPFIAIGYRSADFGGTEAYYLVCAKSVSSVPNFGTGTTSTYLTWVNGVQNSIGTEDSSYCADIVTAI